MVSSVCARRPRLRPRAFFESSRESSRKSTVDVLVALFLSPSSLLFLLFLISVSHFPRPPLSISSSPPPIHLYLFFLFSFQLVLLSSRWSCTLKYPKDHISVSISPPLLQHASCGPRPDPSPTICDQATQKRSTQLPPHRHPRSKTGYCPVPSRSFNTCNLRYSLFRQFRI